MQTSVTDTPYWQDWHEAASLATPEQNDVRAVAFDHRGRLWCATAAGVFWRDGLQWRTPTGGEALGSTHCFLAERDGTLWIGNWQGLFRFDGERVVPGGLSGSLICALALGKEGVLYAAGPQGIWLRRPGGAFEIVQGCWHQAIRAIAPLDAETLWIASASGLYLQNTRNGKPAKRFGTPDQLLSSNIYCLTHLPDGVGDCRHGLWILGPA